MTTTAAVTTYEKFLLFHAQNPHVLDRLIGLAHELCAAGQTRLSIQMLFEVLRYETALQTSGDQFKLNNNYSSYYVRLIQGVDPAIGDLFETRAMKAA